MNSRSFKSRYIIDVSIDNIGIVLTDSLHQRYILSTQPDTIEQFKIWMKTVFISGVSQLSVFEVKKLGGINDTFDFEILKFYLPENKTRDINELKSSGIVNE